MRFLQDKFKCAHCVLKFIALESFAFNLIDPRKDLLEAVLEVFHAYTINFFDFHAFFSQLRAVFRSNSLDRDRSLMNQLNNTSLKFLQLFFLLFGYTKADKFVKAGFHKMVHTRY